MTPLLTLPQAASQLQVSPRSVRRLVDARQVQAFARKWAHEKNFIPPIDTLTKAG